MEAIEEVATGGVTRFDHLPAVGIHGYAFTAITAAPCCWRCCSGCQCSSATVCRAGGLISQERASLALSLSTATAMSSVLGVRVARGFRLHPQGITEVGTGTGNKNRDQQPAQQQSDPVRSQAMDWRKGRS